MTEADENRIRNDLACFREAHPEEFIDLLVESLATRVEDNAITAFRRRDTDDTPDCLIVFFKGYAVAQYAEQAIDALRHQLEESTDREDGDEA